MEPDQELDDLINSEGKGFDREELKARLQSEEEKLIAEILLVNLDNADTIKLDLNNKDTKKEIKSIAHDIVEIGDIW